MWKVCEKWMREGLAVYHDIMESPYQASPMESRRFSVRLESGVVKDALIVVGLNRFGEAVISVMFDDDGDPIELQRRVESLDPKEPYRPVSRRDWERAVKSAERLMAMSLVDINDLDEFGYLPGVLEVLD